MNTVTMTRAQFISICAYHRTSVNAPVLVTRMLPGTKVRLATAVLVTLVD